MNPEIYLSSKLYEATPIKGCSCSPEAGKDNDERMISIGNAMILLLILKGLDRSPALKGFLIISFLLQILDAVERDRSKDDEALEHELEIRVDSKEREAVCKGSEDDNAQRRSSDLSYTAIE